MEKEITRTLLVEDVRGNKEVAYALLNSKNINFLDIKQEICNEELILKSILPDDDYSFDELMKFDVEAKLRHLINIGNIYDELKDSIYTYKISPHNLYFSVNGLPLLSERGIKGQVFPYENISEDEFLSCYKSMVVTLLDETADYNTLINGKLPFYKGDLLCENVVSADSITDVVNLIRDRYLKEKQQNTEKNTRVKKKFLKQLKLMSVIASFIALFAIVVIIYLLVFSIPNKSNIADIRLSFIEKDYTKVVSIAKDENSKSLSHEDKYIVAYSVIMTEPLTEEQKKELSRISMQSNEDYLRYWVLIGQGDIDEAMDVASFLDDPQLLMYGLTKKIDETQRNPDLNSNERTNKINEYKSKLDDLKKKYLRTDDKNKDSK